MTRNLRKPLMCTAVLALVVFTARPGQAQTAHNDLAAIKQGMGAHVMADHQKMMADMQASQKKLDDLVAAMNQATGDDKVNKMAAVVTELVAQHREMCGRMMSGNMMMPMSMMQHALEATAPAPAGNPEDDHATHHPKP
jgi:hypothetical protein